MTPAILVTGAHGFIGRNLVVRLREQGVHVHEAVRETSESELEDFARSSDVLIHLAGSNRPADPDDYHSSNVGLTAHLLDVLERVHQLPVVFASSTQAVLDNPYGRSKRQAEHLVRAYGARTAQQTAVVRLPNVFGKWCRPNYNSVVATFVHNVSRGIPLRIDESSRVMELAYIDDVVELLSGALDGSIFGEDPRPAVVYRTTVGELAAIVNAIHVARSTNHVLEVGTGFQRALYATYVSALDPQEFTYALNAHIDDRGSFTEVLRTSSSGQFSFLTALPGATRGSHYHHTKIEKFVVVNGTARFGFRCLLNGTVHHVIADSHNPVVVESIPGWVHDITNIGDQSLVVLVWANEVFDPTRPDTTAQEV